VASCSVGMVSSATLEIDFRFCH